MIIYRADELKFAKTYELNEEYIELLSLLEKINPCNQYYEAGEDYLIISYEIKQNTRRFAKRQYTWFLKDENVKWFRMDKAEEIDNTIKDIETYISTRLN